MDSDGGNIVNFSSFKKTTRLEKSGGEKSRAEKRREGKKRDEEAAAANRLRFGRTGAEKKQAKREADSRERLLDGKRLTTPASGEDSGPASDESDPT